MARLSDLQRIGILRREDLRNDFNKDRSYPDTFEKFNSDIENDSFGNIDSSVELNDREKSEIDNFYQKKIDRTNKKRLKNNAKLYDALDQNKKGRIKRRIKRSERLGRKEVSLSEERDAELSYLDEGHPEYGKRNDYSSASKGEDFDYIENRSWETQDLVSDTELLRQGEPLNSSIRKINTMDPFQDDISEGPVPIGNSIEGRIKTDIYNFYSEIDKNTDPLIESSRDKIYGISKGRNLRYNEKEEEEVDGNPFLRVWTPERQYTTFKDTLRHNRPGESEGPYVYNNAILGKEALQRLSNYSSLSKTGRPLIAPTGNGENFEKIKNCMFSIENLAWEDRYNELKTCQQGIKGRIMWFPPYNLKFNEQVTSTWNSNKFIGRGEDIYTYTNTERSGTLSFTLLIDHPSAMRSWSTDAIASPGEEQDLLRYWAGYNKGYKSDFVASDEGNKGKVSSQDGEIITNDEAVDRYQAYIFFPHHYTGYTDYNFPSAERYNKGWDALHEKKGQFSVEKGGTPFDYIYNGRSIWIPEDSSEGIGYEMIPGKGLNSNKEVGRKFTKGNFNGTDWSFRVEGRIKKDKECCCDYCDEYEDKKWKAFENGEYISVKTFDDTSTGLNSIVDGFPQDFRNIISDHNPESYISFKELYQILNGIEGEDDRDVKVGFEKKLQSFQKCKIKIESYVPGIGDERIIRKDAKERLETVKKWFQDSSFSSLKNAIFDIYEEKSSVVLNNNSMYGYRGDLFEENNIYEAPKGSFDDVFSPSVEHASDMVKRVERMENIEVVYDDEYFENRDTKFADFVKIDFYDFEDPVKTEDEASVSASTDSSTDETDESYNTETSFRDIQENNDFGEEWIYFRSLQKGDNMAYEMINQKIQYFNPAFHSMSPEGFNERLTFLHQCTRQGPTNSAPEIGGTDNPQGAGNLSFGRPPYCILRIGDFYHTKIAIDSMTIDYGENQWDMNPEGLGMQPMMANISLNFKFIGGSDIEKPVERLQNAISHNFYSNSSLLYREFGRKIEHIDDNLPHLPKVPSSLDMLNKGNGKATR